MKNLIDQILRKLGYIPLSSLPIIDSLTIKEEPFLVEFLQTVIYFNDTPSAIDYQRGKAEYEIRKQLKEELEKFIDISFEERGVLGSVCKGEIKIAIKRK